MRKPNKKSQLEPPIVVSAEHASDVFPSVRYFQIHFEFLQEQIQLILRNQEALKHQMQDLDSRLSTFGQGIRVETRTMSKLERLVAGHTAEQSGHNRTGDR